MSTILNKSAYSKLVEEDIAWLESLPRTLERDHVVAILRESIDAFYPSPNYVVPSRRQA